MLKCMQVPSITVVEQTKTEKLTETEKKIRKTQDHEI